MYRKLDESDDEVLGYAIDGGLGRDEMLRLIAEIEGAIDAGTGKIRLLLRLDAFPYGDLGALWEDLKFDARYSKHIQRCAVVGESALEKAAVKLFNALAPTDTRYFERAGIDQAWQWLRQA